MALARRSVIESIDGAGKSTVAQESALRLSQTYPDQRISVVDSTGIYKYSDGELTSHTWSHIENLEPHQTTDPLAATIKLGMFTVARRMAESLAMQSSDAVIGVRDPFRIDPAVYSLLFGPKSMSKLSPTARLRFFSAFTSSPHPETVVHLQVDPAEAKPTKSFNGLSDSHETEKKLRLVAEELSLVLDGYRKLYGSVVVEVPALGTTTTDQVAAELEPIVSPPVTLVPFPVLPAIQP